MKVNTKVIALMTALAAGVASAQTVDPNKGTNAGTVITNVAQVAFDDPTGVSTTPVTVNSNPVSTTVQPKYAFNITYADGSTDSATTGTVLGAPASYTTTQLPQSTAVFKYAAVNDGNATQTIDLGNAVTSVDASTIKYYPLAADTDGVAGLSAAEIAAADAAPAGDPKAPINSVTVKPQGYDPITDTTNSGIVNFFMVYTVPSTSTTTNASSQPVAGATPVGTGLTGNGTLDVNGQPSGGTPLTETATASPFEQYNQVIIATSGALVGQNGNPDGTGTDLNTSLATTGAPATKIQENGSDKQTAGVTTTQTAVNFTNTLQNPGGLTDTYTLSAPTTLPTGVSSVTFLLPDGTAFTNTPVTLNGVKYYLNASGVPTIEGVAPGAQASFITQPTFTAGGTGTIDLPVTVTSANAVAAGASVTTDTTHNLIAYPAASFGDNTALTTTSNTPNTNYDPNPTAAQGATASLPMVIANTGDAADTYSVQPTTVTFTVVDPATGVQSTVTQPVTYVVDTNCDGTPDSPAVTVPTPVTVNPGAVYCMVAQVTVPSNAIAGQTPAITQTVTTGSGLTLTDSAKPDHITVGLTNTTNPTDNSNGQGVTVAKTRLAPTDVTQAVPGTRLDYQIVATNTYNANVKGFILTEQDGTTNGTATSNVFANSCIVSVSGAVTNPALLTPSKVMYRFNGGTWTTSGTPSGTGIAAGTGNCAGGYTGVNKVEVAIDVNNDDTIDSSDYLAATQVLTVTFNTLIK